MRGRIQNIQVMRALAACSVISFHSIAREGGKFEIGQAGVDIFFVISGFIMWSLIRREVGPISFLRDRILRIIPLYWSATFIMAIGSRIKLFPNLHATTSDLLESLFFIPYCQDGVHSWPLLVPGWTLNYEMFFYLIFAIFLTLGRKFLFLGLITIFSTLVLAGIIFNPQGVLQIFYTRSIIIEFIFGIIISISLEIAPKPNKWIGFSLTLIGLSGFAVLAICPLHMDRVLEWGVPALILVAGTTALEHAGYTLKHWLPNLIGDASYSIYLTHPIVISLGLKFIPHSLHKIAWIILAIASITTGIVVYEIVEKRLIRASQILKKSRVSLIGGRISFSSTK